MLQLPGCDLVGFILQLIMTSLPEVIQNKGDLFVKMP